jgi:two-component system, OmpR family, sensor kinase
MITWFAKYLALCLLLLIGVVWILDQQYLAKQPQSSPETKLIAQWLDHVCAQAGKCQAGDTPLPLVSLQESSALSIDAIAKKRLDAGLIIPLLGSSGEQYYLYRLNDVIATIGPIAPDIHISEPWYAEAFYILLCFVILLSLAPILFDMQRLKQAAIKFTTSRDPKVFRFKHSGFVTPVITTLSWMINKISRLIALQKELTATLSHELRTPISRLKFAVSAIDENNLDLSRQEMMTDLNELDQLISEFLSFAQLEHETPLLNLQTVTIGALISPLIKQLGQYSSKTIEIEPSMLTLEIEADHRTFTRALKNLIENGTKYAKSRVRISVIQQLNNTVFMVEDDGPGLNTNNIDDLFLPYMRSTSNKQAPGYGLGLAIIRKIVEWHGGDVTATHSESLGGACFKITLPNAFQTKN